MWATTPSRYSKDLVIFGLDQSEILMPCQPISDQSPAHIYCSGRTKQFLIGRWLLFRGVLGPVALAIPASQTLWPYSDRAFPHHSARDRLFPQFWGLPTPQRVP